MAARIVGVAQANHRDSEPATAPDAVATLAAAASAAAEDAGGGRALLEAVDTLALTASLGWHPRSAPRLLAERLGIHPRREVQAPTGGETPLALVNHLAREIGAGRARVALLADTHRLRTLRRAHAAGLRLPWPAGGAGDPESFGEERLGHSEREGHYGLSAPAFFYPIFENALRARRGVGLDEHAERLGRLFAPFTEVAARNPHAWLRVARSARELATPSDANRMIAFPYTKWLNALIDVDQSAALVLCSAEAGQELGLAEERAVDWWGGAFAVEPIWHATERPSLASSAALEACLAATLASAGVATDALGGFDLYSCFPVAVELACEALGVAEDDPRGLTLTGGLPYAGGPGNGYCLHALARAVERLRAEPARPLLLTGNGWYFTKHAGTVLGRGPRPQRANRAIAAAAVASQTPVAFADEAAGAARVETYTVLHDREGAPRRGIVVARLGDGRRCLAHTPDERPLLEDLLAKEAVGRAGRVAHRGGRNRFTPA